ncbi:MAG: DNA cytosine methyltransferase [Proteobacteria bacterium]|uniref:Cytosine-specific methyltransferase n=1 Tax=Candidatus Avisuccinivibrio stercorigallinarum TaxID=2840704 RepID=A0A9D9DB44_9GAMM|nr:DNA cytosine methyltransferase [Candidatus Avisuccinivibrio stercorigallinarum]
MQDFLTTAEASALLHKTAQSVRTMIRTGELPAQRAGRTWLIKAADFKKFYEQSCGSFSALTPSADDASCKEVPANDGSRKKPVALSFFSGAMGLDLGLEKAGFDIKLACEVDKTCQKTIRANRPDLPLIGDIRSYTKDDILRLSGVCGDIDLIAGGPPCQAFSTAGARRGFEDERGNVFLVFIDLLKELNPRYIVIENVRGLLSAPLKHTPHAARDEGWVEGILGKPGGALLYIIERLRGAGYSVSFNLYNTANYGVPQLRERVVMICSRDGSRVPYIAPTADQYGRFGLPVWKTLREAVQGLTSCHHSEFPEKRLKFYRLLGPGQYWKDLPEELQPEAMGSSYSLPGGKTGFYRRLSWDRPSCTLVTSPTMPATDICHPTEDRPLSVEEYKRIQCFPDDWIFAGDLVRQYKQIGNAVPVKMGEAIGRAVLNHMHGRQVLPPEGFPFSRYKLTDDVSWEAKVRASFGLQQNEELSSQLQELKTA